MDRDLVIAARRGDQAAFMDLVRPRSEWLFGIALQILRDIDRAEDALQDTLVIAWRDLRGLRDPDRFDAWLRRVLVDACIREASRQRRRAMNLRVLPVDGPAAPDDLLSLSLIGTSSNAGSVGCRLINGRSSCSITSWATPRPRSPRVLASRQRAHRGGDSYGHSHGCHATGRNSLPDRSGFRSNAVASASVQIRKVVAAPDKFKGTATAAEVARRSATPVGNWASTASRYRWPTAATDPRSARRPEPHLGRHRSARRSAGGAVAVGQGTAVIEMARASGLALVGGAAGNSALDATTSGTGELIDHALDAGARRIIVGPRRVGDHRRRLRRRSGDHRDRLGSSRSNCSWRAT